MHFYAKSERVYETFALWTFYDVLQYTSIDNVGEEHNMLIL